MVVVSGQPQNKDTKYAVRVVLQDSNHSIYFYTLPAAMYAYWIAINRDPIDMWNHLYEPDKRAYYVSVYERSADDTWKVMYSSDMN